MPRHDPAARHARPLRAILAGFAAVLPLAVILMVAADAQTTKRKAGTKGKTSQAQMQAGADSLARADSLLRVAAVQAAAESLWRSQDSVQAFARDTVQAFVFRKIDNSAFGVGERLVFDISYGLITAGEATLTIAGYDSIAGRTAFRVEVLVNSLPSFSWIYKVEDRYLTFIDVEAIASLRFEQHIREGSYVRDFVAEFDHPNGVARTSEGEFPIPPYVHDIMSAFYYARTLDLGSMQDGDLVTLQNFYKDKTYDLGVRILGRQELEVPAGTFHTIVVEPLVREGGLFKSEGRIVIWLTDDERKMPVRVNTKVIIGSIDTELREYSGTSGPVRARIQ